MSDPPDVATEQFGLDDHPAASFDLESASSTVELGRTLGRYAEAGDVVGLIGALGSGKTTLVSGVVDALGSERPAQSPTYTLVHRHETTPPSIHVDLYRLDSVDGLETTGYWDFIRTRDAIVCVEWLNRVPEAWPGDGWLIALRHRPEGRRAHLWADDSRRGRLDALIDSWRGRR